MNYQINSFGSKSKEKKVSKERKCCTVHGEEVWSLWSKLYKPAGDWTGEVSLIFGFFAALKTAFFFNVLIVCHIYQKKKLCWISK
jgi:hypothetical protein